MDNEDRGMRAHPLHIAFSQQGLLNPIKPAYD